ncbi:MAG TPA: family 16 glycosylhydrolase, partial [Ktedonobacterales bacterium]|nr:family 16 glycosylhydrolase [Ktedonobacterales bacterium]
IVTADVGYDTCPTLTAPDYREIDLTECYNYQPNPSPMTPSNWCQLAMAQTDGWRWCQYPVDDQWHDYTVIWSPSVISVAVDGKPPACSFSAADGYVIPAKPMFLIIQTQTGGVGGITNDSLLPTRLQVSNVTVTQP